MDKFKITNGNKVVLWEGEAFSFFSAWHKMFDACKYPISADARKISEQINLGLWIEKVN